MVDCFVGVVIGGAEATTDGSMERVDSMEESKVWFYAVFHRLPFFLGVCFVFYQICFFFAFLCFAAVVSFPVLQLHSFTAFSFFFFFSFMSYRVPWCSFYIITVHNTNPDWIYVAIKYIQSIDVHIISVDYDLFEIYTYAQVDSLKLRRFNTYRPEWFKDRIYVAFRDKNNICSNWLYSSTMREEKQIAPKREG